VQWQVSYNNGTSYSNLGVADPILPDTLTLAVSGTQNVLVKAVVSAPNCNSSTTTQLSIAVRCATVFTQPIAASAGNYISNFTLHTLSKNSTPLWRSGSYEAFTTTTVDLCKGVSYPVTISHVPASTSLTRVLWMDFNNDGDFSDQNELVIPPNTGSGILSEQITIPVSSTAVGNVRIRVMVYDAGTSTPNSDPCFAGPYQSGEIEEYTVVLTNPVEALAGADKIVCSGGANLAGSSPFPGFGVWSVVSGPAIVVSSGNANSPVTGIGLIPSVLVWKVTSGPCVSTDTMTIKREAKTLALRNDTTICENDSLLLDAGAGYAGYQWVNGNTNSSITVYNQGLYWVQVTTVNNCIFKDSVQVNEQICTVISKTETRFSDVEIYPNPSSGSFVLKSGQIGVHLIRVSDAMGRKVFETSLNSVDESATLNMVLPSGLKGLFQMEVTSTSKKWTRKLWVR
jgi:hypothetical protein